MNDDIRMMQDSISWPRWPLLPLKRESRRNPWPELGVMFAGDAKPTVHVEVPIFGAPPGVRTYRDLLQLAKRKIDYESFDALVADGWRID